MSEMKRGDVYGTTQNKCRYEIMLSNDTYVWFQSEDRVTHCMLKKQFLANVTKVSSTIGMINQEVIHE